MLTAVNFSKEYKSNVSFKLKTQVSSEHKSCQKLIIIFDINDNAMLLTKQHIKNEQRWTNQPEKNIKMIKAINTKDVITIKDTI